MKQQNIEVTLGQWQSSESVACVTVIDEHSGRKARCWLSVVMKPNGKPYATLTTLGRKEGGDRMATRAMAWHKDLT